MKGCARSCLLWLIGWAAASGAFFFYLRRFGVLDPQIWWAAGGAGCVRVLAISYARGHRASSRKSARCCSARWWGSRRRTGSGWRSAARSVRSIRCARRSPASRRWRTSTTSIAWKRDRAAELQHLEILVLRRQGARAEHDRHEAGRGPPPGRAHARHARRGDQDAAGIANAKQYVSETTLPDVQHAEGRAVGMEHETTDDDGIFRVDKRGIPDADVDIADCTLAERYIKQGETVCAFGLYSAARGGLIPHPNWAKQARLMRGDATAVAGQLRTRMIKYVFGILIFGARRVRNREALRALTRKPRARWTCRSSQKQERLRSCLMPQRCSLQFTENWTVRSRYDSTAWPLSEPGVKRHACTVATTASLKGAIARERSRCGSRTWPFLSMTQRTTTVALILVLTSSCG